MLVPSRDDLDRTVAQPPADTLALRMEAALIERISGPRFQMWFHDHAKFVSAGRELLVAVANHQFQEWLESTFGDAVRAAAASVYGRATPVRFVVDAALFPDLAEPTAKADKSAAPKSKEKGKPHIFGEDTAPPPSPRGKNAKPAKPEGKGRRWKTLADFVTGSCNRVAHASALSAVEEPGQGANPLVLHGPVGTGKTHLLEGIYAGLRRAVPDARPCYITAEEFTTRFVQASRFEKHGQFRKQFRECYALLLDDLHFLATKPGTQREFIHTLDALVADGLQVVVTTDCHPRLAEELMPELVDRLLGGAIWSLQPPDDSTRLEILRKKATGGHPVIPDSVLKFLAKNLPGNVRELEGAINSVRHVAKVTNAPIDLNLVREALGDLLRHTVRAVTVGDVDHAVCAVLRLASGSLQSKARSWAVSHPRMLAIFLCRKHTAATYGQIAKHFGAKTHSTAVAAEKKVRAWLAADEKLTVGERIWLAKDLVARLERELQR
jgi:chromosomal replication initiator protein